ncbi:MAG: GTPase ObgE [Candidatus Marinimicrobia bacterium]|jgi:GTP-binding protein|nr:GTPase ObgE [Candidatus Neomarinimicrobiota bacterium]MBT3630394.1 GTPase ObgE [Candidatus Neomarinimicrobiota bacterium]MBT3823713.1 GTPase ObgE [Candidatus Neomarinimicrobiota bacterium]MBT4131938.1 GTPase ObgE [Candidatus Neomarinimicrobiota bacterium]MBT4294664.1 GTPase ObgE [Candidatus Neomarinimicrobiota bacterium]
MRFVDYVKIKVIPGKGGDGIIAFRREKFVPKGGPAGGNGGRGGSIILKVDTQLHTLQDIRYHRIYKANRGKHGEGSLRHGKKGEDIIVKVPAGTIVKDLHNGEVVADLQIDGESVVVARGGRGGRGNAEFATPTHQAPREFEYGREGREHELELELKVLADVGLVGFPNAGKSTLLSRVSRAKPKIADYPFTTLTPNLGIVKSGAYSSFVMADIPGLIEGAHEGKGLGTQFLKHVERCSVLLFLVDANDEDPAESYRLLFQEVQKYSPGLIQRKRLLAITKMDSFVGVPKMSTFEPIELFPISSVSGEGLENLIKALTTSISE